MWVQPPFLQYAHQNYLGLPLYALLFTLLNALLHAALNSDSFNTGNVPHSGFTFIADGVLAVRFWFGACASVL